MDLHGTDDWIFETLGINNNSENKRPQSSLDGLKSTNKSVSNIEIETLKRSIHQYELRQQTNEQEKRVFVDNFYRLLITARSQINQLEKKNRELDEKLNSYMSVKCPACEHLFRANSSRVLPDYVRYLKSCNRLELNFKNEQDLKKWLLISNLDTDKDGLPVIQKNVSIAKTLKEVGSLLVKSEDRKKVDLKTIKKDTKTSFRLDVENLSSRISIQELKEMFTQVADISFAHLHDKNRNTAVVYFHYHNHLKRVMDKFQNKTLNGRRIKLVDKTVVESKSSERADKKSRH